MDVFGALAKWLGVSEEPVPADAIVVLDGGEGGNRMMKGIELLNSGFAPCLLASHSLPYHDMDRLQGGSAAQAQAGRVLRMYHDRVSTRGEAAEALEQAKRLGCSRVLVVTSSYHTRRTRRIFARFFGKEGIGVRTIAAPVPDPGGTPWWRTRRGRSLILFELIKLIQTSLGLNSPFSATRHIQTARLVERFLYRISG